MQLYEVLQDFRPRRRSNACCIDVVLQRNGSSMKRAAVAMAFATARRAEFGFGFVGLGKGKFRSDGEVGIELGIESLDAGEHEFGQFNGRELALAEEFSDFFDGRESKTRVVHAQKIFSW